MWLLMDFLLVKNIFFTVLLSKVTSQVAQTPDRTPMNVKLYTGNSS